MKKWGHLFIYHVYSHSYVHQNVKNGSFFVFSADRSKKSVTVSAKYTNVSERSYLANSENAMYYWVLGYN